MIYQVHLLIFLFAVIHVVYVAGTLLVGLIQARGFRPKKGGLWAGGWMGRVKQGSGVGRAPPTTRAPPLPPVTGQAVA
jgi:hypothetical protein